MKKKRKKIVAKYDDQWLATYWIVSHIGWTVHAVHTADADADTDLICKPFRMPEYAVDGTHHTTRYRLVDVWIFQWESISSNSDALNLRPPFT